ncbi:MAG TPA: S41 family peptidase, partial [Fibrobacteraceae bacterium]|nr:S41 family peptidase [Fibrobacteraceae bacterium]
MKTKVFISSSFFLFMVLFFSLLFMSCTQEYKPLNPNNQEPQNRNDSIAYEFEWNYLLLKGFYFYADQELYGIDYYDGLLKSNDPYAKIYAMYEEMSDPFTQYFSPEYFDMVMNALIYSESTSGLGFEINKDLKVTQVYENGPAEKEGLQRGDLVLMVDSNSFSSKEIFDRLVEGEVDDEREIIVKRDSDTLSFTIAIDYISMPTVFLDSLDSIPLIKITEFTDTTSNVGGTYAEFKNALIKTDGAAATIIDLRGNPGGSILHCTKMAAEFLSKNDTVINEISKDLDSTTFEQVTDTAVYIAQKDGLGKGRYYVFLQDEGSASCSEILIAGVTTNLKSPVIGTLSYGKGIGQYYFITYLSGIAGVTSFNFYDKSFETYNHRGIMPDFVFESDSLILAKAAELAKAKTYKRTKKYGTTYKAFEKKASNSQKGTAQNKPGAFK